LLRLHTTSPLHTPDTLDGFPKSRLPPWANQR
jgi:hypothetical protein